MLKSYIIDYLPILTIAIYILAVIYNVAYYSVYGINIMQYVTIGEMFMSIIEPLVLFLLIMLGTICFFSLLEHASSPKLREAIKKLVIKSEKPKTKSVKKQSFVKRKIKKIKRIWQKLVYKLTTHKFRDRIKKWNSTKIADFIIIRDFGLVQLLCYAITGSAFLYYTMIKPEVSGMGMFIAVITMFFPFYLCAGCEGGEKSLFVIIKEASKLEIIVSIFMYYLFCIALFYDSGRECALVNKKTDDVRFEIKTTDGTVFSDKDYGYIEQLNNCYLLYDRQTEDVNILYTGNVMFSKINLGNRGAGLIPLVLKKTGDMIEHPLK